jgi:hypothetical protein
MVGAISRPKFDEYFPHGIGYDFGHLPPDISIAEQIPTMHMQSTGMATID